VSALSRISVVIPCYRDSATLGRALASLQRQTRPADEIIVVDDCSPEGAEIQQVLEKFPQVRYVRNATNLGLAGTRNEGLSLVTCDVVTFMDADDEAHPQRFEYQVRHVASRQAVACDVAIVPAGKAAPNHRQFTSEPIKVYRSPDQIAYFNRLTGASLMAHTALLKSMGGYDPELRSCEDFDLWLRLLMGEVTVHRIRLPLYIYHQNPRGLSRDYRSIGHWELEVISRLARSGWIGDPASLKVGTVWAMWLAKQYARGASTGDPVLAKLADAQLHRLSMWPYLKMILKIFAAIRFLGLYRFIR
jgi:glycosyltransferase involved in cell wall biosynthesis